MNENKNEMEDVKLFMNEIYTINNFINISSQTIDFLSNLFSSSKNAINIQTLLDLIDFASKLESRNFKNYLQSNKKFKNSIYQLTISTIIYEEIFNKPVHKSHFISIREHYQDLEETLNLFIFNKQITLNFDIIQEKMIFLRSGQEFYELIGTNFLNLFPKEVYEYQKDLLKEILCFSTGKDNLIKSAKLIIKVPDNSTLYNIIKINFKILLHNENVSIITIDGIYSLYTNILISYTKNDVEYFFGSGIKISQQIFSKNNFIKFNDILKIRFKDGIKFDYSFKSESYTFNVYKIGEEKVENENIDLYNHTEMVNNSRSYILANFQSGLSSSSVASVNSVKSKSRNIDKAKLKTINSTTKEVNMKFFIYQKLIIVFILLLFILTFIEVIQKKTRRKTLIENYDLYTKLRLVSRTYNYMTSAYRSVTCLILSENKTCINYLQKYNDYFNKIYGTSFDIVYAQYISNELKIRHESSYMSELWARVYSNSDKSVRNLFIDNFVYKDISSIENNGSLIVTYTENNFMESFKATINSFIIVNSSNLDYIEQPFFILDIKNKKLLNYYPMERKSWRVELYNIIVNYENFCEHFDIITNKFNDKLSKELKYYLEETIIYMVINCLVELMEIFIIVLYLQTFEKVMYKIYKHIKKRISSQNFNPCFLRKLEKLKELTFIYSTHPKSILEGLQEIYDKYKKKIKEHQRKNILDFPPPKTIKKKLDTNEKRIIKEIKSIPISIFARRLYQISLLISLLIFTIFTILWINIIDKVKLLFNYININSQIESTAYRSFFFYQQILYTTETLDEESENFGIDFDELILYQEELTVEIIAESEKIIDVLSSYNTIGLTCESFYNSIQDIRVVKFENENPEFELTKKLIEICNVKQFLGYISDNFLTQKAFSLIYKGIMSITQINNYNREYFFVQSNYYYDALYYLYMIFRIYRTGMNKIVYTPSIQYFIKQIYFLFTIEAITEIILEIILLICVIFMFVIKINFVYKRLLAITDIIKISRDDNIIV